MSAYGLSKAVDEVRLKGELRLAYLAVGDCGGIPSVASVAMWVNCSDARAEGLISDLLELGLLRSVAGFTWAPNLYEGKPPVERTGRRSPTKQMRDAVLSRSGRVCAYCGDKNGPFHIFPHSRGGETALTNLTVACAGCNLRKRDKTPEEMGWRK